MSSTLAPPINRSPHHQAALSADDLYPGLVIELHNLHDGRSSKTATIVGEPLQRGYKLSDDSDALAESWFIPVETTNHLGRLVRQNWYLTDIGATPVEGEDGTLRWGENRMYVLEAVG